MLVQDVPEQESAREGEGAFKTAPRAVEVINLGFASDLNTSSYKVVVEKTGQILASNQLEFDEEFFPYRKEELIASLADTDNGIDIVYKASAPIRWMDHDPSSPASYVQEGGHGI
jgi:hypothetical protein